MLSSLTGSAVSAFGSGSAEGSDVGSVVGGAVEVGVIAKVVSSGVVPLEQADNAKSKSAKTSAIILVCFIFYIPLSVRRFAETPEAGSTDL